MTDTLDFENSQMLSGGHKSEGTKSSTAVEFDNVFQALGSSFRHQILQIIIVLLCLLPYSFGVFSFVFIGYEPPHVCAETNETELLNTYSLLNDTTAKFVYEMCKIRITSNQTGHPEDVASTGCISGHSYEGGKYVSIKTEWDLVCEKTGLAELVYLTLNVGMSVGSLAINPLSDKCGRKYVIVFCLAIGAAFEFGQVFCQSVYAMISLKLLSGVAVQNLCFTPYLLGAEIIETRYRDIYATVTILAWTSVSIIVGIFAYALRSYSWRLLQVCSSLSGVLPLLLVYFLNESVPWLFAKGRHSRALTIIKKTCESNGANYSVVENAYNNCVRRVDSSQDGEKSDTAKYGLMDIIRHRKLLITSLILCLTWFTHNTTYYGLYLIPSTFSLSRYFMFIILSATEFPSTFLFKLVLPYIGRRTIVMLFLSLTGICLICSSILIGLGDLTSRTIADASTVFFLLGKFSINTSYSSVYSFTNEQFPTTLRNTGQASCAFATRIGGMVAPFLHPLFRIANWAPGTILSALCFISVSLYTLVPETKGRELPVTIEAVKALHIKQGKKESNRIKLLSPRNV